MSKPLFRWTVGSCLQQGLDILVESVHRTTRALGQDNFDWVICYNGLNRESLEFLQKGIGNKPVQFVAQNWIMCPINDNCQTPRRNDGSFQWDGSKCGGTLWKVCPARMRMESHEIVMDNDIVLLKRFPQFDEFLAATDKALILEEPIRFYGRYDALFPPGESCLNSGLMGLPPGYDFGAKIQQNWSRYGGYTNLSQADEQGLLTYTLRDLPSVRVKKEQMVEVLHRDFKTQLTGREEGIHFTQANRIENHHCWKRYQEIVGRSII